MKLMHKTGLPELAVKRPLLITVLNLLIVIAGLAALLGIDIRELPDVDYPIVTVRANLPGAAPETMDAEVTSVLEGAVARVSGVDEISASSEENNTRIRISFNPGVDLDTAASDVREAVNRVARQLPDRVENLFVTKADDDSSPILTIAVTSTAYTEDELTRIIDRNIAPEILSIDGVASVSEFGTRQRQMRVVIDPLRLNRFGFTVTDVVDALRQAPFDVPVGSFRSDDQELIVRAEATAATPELIEDVVIAGAIKVGDVADAIIAPADATNLLRLNGEPVIGLGVVRRAQSNTINISDAVNEKVAQINQRLDDVTVQVTADEAIFIRTSVNDVLTTLIFAVVIVILTILLFLGSGQATIVPAVSVPIALVGTLAGIWLMGFSINLLTLLALVLATGLIVDDAIVVLENIQRKQSQGLRSHAAAAIGTRQVFFAVVSTTLVLVAVFVPISFLPSTVGRLFREFGFVLAFAVVISSFVALTLAPAIAAQLSLGGQSGTTPSLLMRFGNRIKDIYSRSLQVSLNRPLSSVVLAITVGGIGLWIFTQLESELVPTEDRGQITVFATGPDGVGLSYMERQAAQIEERLQPYIDDGTIESVYTVVGRFDPNRVSVTVRLAPWSERNISQQELIAALRRPMSEIPGARVSVFGSSSLSAGRGNRNGLEAALTGGDYQEIYLAARALSDEIETRSTILSNPEISYQPTQPQLSIKIDRQRASDLGVPLDEISLTLRTMVGGERVVDLNVNDQAIPILLEAQTDAIQSPEDLSNLFVRSSAGDLVSLSSLTTLVEEGVAAELDRVEQRRAIEVEADIAAGATLAEAIAEFSRIADEVLPDDIEMILEGNAESLREANRDMLLTFGFAFLIVFMVLVAQFESISSPVIVILIVPFGLAAAVFAMFFSNTSLNIYSQIGLVLLIGLMAKNGVLLVEFADRLRGEGLSVRDAIFKAATVRVRPIMMTVTSTALGVLPLILSSGAGAEARHAIGWVIFGGIGLAAIFTLYLSPVLYLGLAHLSKARTSGSEKLDEQLEQAARQELVE
ncbi:MAG: efflux RND transporter permease subunit [Aquisalinus sp.]|nr:efflux RND transporter permease subunit [Aquisalinus sp.]